MAPKVVVLIRLAVAVPPDSVAVPRSLFAVVSTKWTVPVGVPKPGLTAVTVAVNVTPCPYTDGLVNALTVVLLLDWLTVWVNEPPLLMKLLSPL